jgi:hypothetical protein
MQAGTDLSEQPTNLEKSALTGHEGDSLAKLMPIGFGLLAGMLIMLLVMYFFPREYKQNQAQSPASSPETAQQTNPSPIPVTAPAAVDPSSIGLPLGTSVQSTSTTASGYPVYTTGAPRAVDYFGPQGNDEVIVQPNYDPASGPWLNPCVDPPSVKGPTYRVVER